MEIEDIGCTEHMHKDMFRGTNIFNFQ